MQYFSVVLGEPYEGRYEEEEEKKATMTHTYASRSPGRSADQIIHKRFGKR